MLNRVEGQLGHSLQSFKISLLHQMLNEQKCLEISRIDTKMILNHTSSQILKIQLILIIMLINLKDLIESIWECQVTMKERVSFLEIESYTKIDEIRYRNQEWVIKIKLGHSDRICLMRWQQYHESFWYC